MAKPLVNLPIPGLHTAGLDRLTRAVAAIRAGKPLAHGGPMHHMRAVADGIELLELRPLLAGESARRVDWRASARSRHPMVRRYRDERSGEWLICLDQSASMGVTTGVWTLGQQLAAASAYLIQHFGHRVGLALFDDRPGTLCPPARGRAAFLRIVQTLAKTRPRPAGGGSRPECCVPLLDRGRRLLLISDCLREDFMIPALDHLLAAGGGAELIQLDAPPPVLVDGPCLIEDAESGERRSIHAGARSDTAARRAREAIGQALAAHCASRRIPHTRAEQAAHPDDPEHWQHIILGHLTRSGPTGGHHE